MSNRDLAMQGEQSERVHKGKSYLEADTTMRAQFDAQHDAVTEKVDEVMASFRQTPPPRPQTAPGASEKPKAVPAAKVNAPVVATPPAAALAQPLPSPSANGTYRHTLHQSSPARKFILGGLLVLGAAAGFYYLQQPSASDQDTTAIQAQTAAPAATQVPEKNVAATAAIAETGMTNEPVLESAPVPVAPAQATIPQPKQPPVKAAPVRKPRGPANKGGKSAARYSENI